jgi:hypothetical protein
MQEIGLKVSARSITLVAVGKINAAAFMPNGATTLGWQQKRKKIENDGGRKKGDQSMMG